jgi:hypothetical protein
MRGRREGGGEATPLYCSRLSSIQDEEDCNHTTITATKIKRKIQTFC